MPILFSTELRDAIERRGLGLQRLAARLQERGTSVSVATLSYWQSGRSQPERATSLQTLANLEEILEVPEGHLSSLVSSRPSRSRLWRTSEGLSRAGEFIPDWQFLKARVGGGVGQFKVLSMDDAMFVGPHRYATHQMQRITVRAEIDGAQRYPMFYVQDVLGARPPDAEVLEGAELSRVKHPNPRILLADVVLDEPLRRGETATVVTRVEMNEPVTVTHGRREPEMVSQVTVRAHFHPDALPANAWQVTTAGGQEQETHVRLRANHQLHQVSTNLLGHSGFR